MKCRSLEKRKSGRRNRTGSDRIERIEFMNDGNFNGREKWSVTEWLHNISFCRNRKVLEAEIEDKEKRTSACIGAYGWMEQLRQAEFTPFISFYHFLFHIRPIDTETFLCPPIFSSCYRIIIFFIVLSHTIHKVFQFPEPEVWYSFKNLFSKLSTIIENWIFV